MANEFQASIIIAYVVYTVSREQIEKEGQNSMMRLARKHLDWWAVVLAVGFMIIQVICDLSCQR